MWSLLIPPIKVIFVRIVIWMHLSLEENMPYVVRRVCFVA